MPADHRDDGAATVWVLAAGLLAVLVALSAAAVGAAIVARHEAQTAADLAALAGASRVVDGEARACGFARQVAEANGAQLVSCHVDGWDVVVSTLVVPARIAAVGGSATASARAGPV